MNSFARQILRDCQISQQGDRLRILAPNQDEADLLRHFAPLLFQELKQGFEIWHRGSSTSYAQYSPHHHYEFILNFLQRQEEHTVWVNPSLEARSWKKTRTRHEPSY